MSPWAMMACSISNSSITTGTAGLAVATLVLVAVATSIIPVLKVTKARHFKMH
jgi:hypothetical protein